MNEVQLNAAGAAFLKAVQAASRHEQQCKRRRMLLLRCAKTAIAVLIVLGAGGALGLFAFNLRPVEATPFMGMQGLVVSSYDLNPVPGMEVRRIDTGTEGKPSLVLVAATNAQGMFEIPASTSSTPSAYELRMDGRRISQFQTGASEQYMRGYEKFVVDVPLARNKRTANITLNPGQRVSLNASASIELDSAAEDRWTGTLTDDKQWPSNFLFGQVAAGIYRLDGPPSKHLRLIARIDSDVLKFYQADATDISVITHSEEYRERELANTPHGWKAHAHQGWYVLGRAVADYTFLDSQRPMIRQISTAAGNSAEVIWSAQVDTPYAVLIPPQEVGEAETYWLQRSVNGQPWMAPGVQIMGRHRLQPLIYSVTYYSPENRRSFRYPAYFYCPARECWFSDGEEPQDYYHTGFTVPLTQMFTANDVPGEFALQLMDFTTTNVVDYPAIKHHGTEAPGTYEILVDPGELGQVTELKLAGELSALARPPEWDFYCDGIVDAYGNTAELRIQHHGSYNIRAIVNEGNGNTVFVERSYKCALPGLLGYEPWGMFDVPVLSGVVACPEQAGSIRAVSMNAVASPSAYGYSASGIAGPLVYFQPPPEFQHTPLKEVRCYLYGRAVGGDALPTTSGLQQHLNVDYLLATPSTGENAPLDMRGDFTRSDGTVFFVNASGHSWNIKNFLARVDDSSLDEAMEYLRRENFTWQSKTVFKALTGLDMADLPPDEEVVRVLREFQRSPYYAVRYAPVATGELRWTSKLWGLELENGQGLVASIILNDYNLLYAGQWEFYSGPQHPARIELITEDGRSWTGYFDYSIIAED